MNRSYVRKGAGGERVRERRALRLMFGIAMAVMASVLLLSLGFRWLPGIMEAPDVTPGAMPLPEEQEPASLPLNPIEDPPAEGQDPPGVAVPVLMFHMFTYDRSLWNYMTISPHAFRSHLLALKEAGYTTVHPHELVAYVEGRGKLPDKPVLITVDDGYLDNFTLAYPILQELNMKATFFVIGRLIDNNHQSTLQYFGWDEARTMFESGLISIQPHSYDLHNEGDPARQIGKGVSRHGFETDAEYEERFLSDTARIMDLIRERVGDVPVAYGYPYGIHNSHAESLLAQLGISITLTVKEGVAFTGAGLTLTPRINVPHGMSSSRLLQRMEMRK